MYQFPTPQLTPRQASQHFHLEQTLLGMHVAKGTVRIRLITCGDMRHAAFIELHVDRCLQPGQVNHPLAARLFAI